MKKTPYDFCYVYRDGSVISLDTFLFDEKMPAAFCGLSPVPHFPDSYALYFDHSFKNGYPSKGYLGVCSHDSMLTSPIPKGSFAVEIIHFDREEYETHKNHEI